MTAGNHEVLAVVSERNRRAPAVSPTPSRGAARYLAVGLAVVASLGAAPALATDLAATHATASLNAGPTTATRDLGIWRHMPPRLRPVARPNTRSVAHYLRASDDQRGALDWGDTPRRAVQKPGVTTQIATLSNDAVARHLAAGTSYSHMTPRARANFADDIPNQNRTGTCWEQAATDHVEQAHFTATGERLQLSPWYSNRVTWSRRARATLRRIVLQDGSLEKVTIPGEGGQFFMAQENHAEYGQVPEHLFVRTGNTDDTARPLAELQDKIVELAAQALAAPAAQRSALVAALEPQLETLLDNQIGHLDPSQLDATGRFEHVGPDGVARRYTPREFGNHYVQSRLGQQGVFTNDLGQPKHTWVKIGRRPGFRRTGWAFNVGMDTLKSVVARQHENGQTSWIAYEAGGLYAAPAGGAANDPRFGLVAGVHSTRLFDPRLLGGPGLLAKTTAQAVGLHALNHAVSTNGHNVGPSGEIDRFLVRNSWGAGAMDGGYMHFYASDEPSQPEFFEQFVRQATGDFAHQPKALRAMMMKAWIAQGLGASPAAR